MKNSGKVLIGILGAAAAGVVIGMILAPQKGKDLRKDITKSAGDVVQKLSDLLTKGKEKYDELRSMVSEKSDDVKTRPKKWVSRQPILTMIIQQKQASLTRK